MVDRPTMSGGFRWPLPWDEAPPWKSTTTVTRIAGCLTYMDTASRSMKSKKYCGTKATICRVMKIPGSSLVKPMQGVTFKSSIRRMKKVMAYSSLPPMNPAKKPNGRIGDAENGDEPWPNHRDIRRVGTKRKFAPSSTTTKTKPKTNKPQKSKRHWKMNVSL